MILFPDCKINLGLHILSRRGDGYHNIETVMFPVRGLTDALEILPSDDGGATFSSSGLAVDGPAERNLCIRAYDALRREYPVGGVRMHLHKAVPMGAGLGGGSADAAYVIRGLSTLFGLDLDKATMERIAAGIGSDTAFFIADRPALATGRGEVLSPIGLNLSGYSLVIVKPDEYVSTAEAYSQVVPRTPPHRLADLLSAPLASWRDCVVNDFEPSVFRRHPLLAQVKEELYRQGAVYAAMSGSGAALFGIFDDKCPDLSLFGKMFIYQEDMI